MFDNARRCSSLAPSEESRALPFAVPLRPGVPAVPGDAFDFSISTRFN